MDAHPGTAHGHTVGSVRGKKASVETARAFLGKSLLVQATRSLALDAFLGASGWWRPQDSSWFWREVGSSGGSTRRWAAQFTKHTGRGEKVHALPHYATLPAT